MMVNFNGPGDPHEGGGMGSFRKSAQEQRGWQREKCKEDSREGAFRAR